MKTIALTLTVLFAVACSNVKNANVSSYSHETECVRDNFDGTYVVKAWGHGANVMEDIKLAKKNALSDIIFKGLTYGKSDCGGAPLVSEPNARQNHEVYFNKFFGEKGDYLNFIDVAPGADIDKNKVVTLIVKKSSLKQKLITDGIIKNM